MQRKANNWFNEIEAPKPSSVLGQSADYLDRLIGGQSSSQKRYYMPTVKRNKDGTTKKVNNQQPKRENNSAIPKDNVPNKTKLAITDIDDTKWIEERKRKFPKIDDVRLKVETSYQIPVENTSDLKNIEPINKPNKSKVINRQVNQRKKTLFEMLMDPED